MPGRVNGGKRRFEGKHHLEQRISTEIARSIQLMNQLSERNGIVIESFKRYVAYPPQQFAKGRIAGKIRAQNYGIEKISKQRLRFRAIATSSNAADREIILAGVSGEERCEPCEQRLKQRDTFLPGQRPNRIGQFGAQRERIHAAAKCLHRGRGRRSGRLRTGRSRRDSAAKTRCVSRAHRPQAIFFANNCNPDTECPDGSGAAMEGLQPSAWYRAANSGRKTR